MFQAELKKRFEKIFGFKKTTYDAPSDSFEQDTLFIEITDCKTRPSEGKVYARVTGQLVAFSQNERLPYGFFSKRIEKAKHELTKDLFFYDVDRNVVSSPARLQNISERRTSFQFFFTAQYDPNLGELTTLEMECNDG